MGGGQGGGGELGGGEPFSAKTWGRSGGERDRGGDFIAGVGISNFSKGDGGGGEGGGGGKKMEPTPAIGGVLGSEPNRLPSADEKKVLVDLGRWGARGSAGGKAGAGGAKRAEGASGTVGIFGEAN